jgi:hypothetical protein
MGRLVEVADTKLYVEERGSRRRSRCWLSMAGPGSIIQSSAIIWIR